MQVVVRIYCAPEVLEVRLCATDEDGARGTCCPAVVAGAAESINME